MPNYQPPPDYGTPPAAPDAPAPTPPSSVLAAVKLMYVGAGLSALWTILLFPQRGMIRDELSAQDLGGADPDSVTNAAVAGMVVIGLLTIGMWLWMAHANQRGHAWARIVATVLGSIAILFMLFSFIQLPGGGNGISIILNIGLIVLAASILWLLYRPDSKVYYAAVTKPPRY
jgi:hypothetical protein